jgi:SAM-dependent methyltransferase
MGDQGMFFSINVPFRKQEVEDYERRRYRGLDQKIVDRREKRILRKILKEIGADSRLALDAPCGYGRFSTLLLERGVKLTSTDYSFYMVKRTKEKEEHSRVALGVVADLKRGLPFKKETFDFVLSMRFFHHVHQANERASILKEYARVSRAWVILSYYQLNWLHSLQRKLRRRIKKSKTQIKMISRSDFEKEVRASGFRVVRIFPLFRGIHAHRIALLAKS